MAIDPNNLQGTAHATFDDEFNSLNLWSPSNPSGTWATTFWYADPNGNGGSLPSNGEQEWYINSNDAATSSVKPWTVNNGVLTLTAAPASSSISPLINNYSYTSGMINTYHSFSQTYGYFEMRAQLPAGQGFWPAFWLLPESGAWPPELDVMEVLGQNTNLLYNTVHTEETGTHTAAGQQEVVADMSAGYHTYGVDWEPDYITFYFDGQALFKTPTPSDMNQPMYMIANLAAGGSWPGSVTPGSVGQMNIDWIRAYAAGAGPSTASSTSSAAPAPVTTAPTSTTTATTTTQTATTPTTTTTAPTTTQTASTSGSGQTFTADNAGDHLTGTAGADVFNLGRGGDVVTGNGGADVFKFAQLPWAGGHITDFSAQDTLDLSGMFASLGYTGSNPLQDGHLQFTSDGQGGTQVWFNASGLAGLSGNWLVTTLDHVNPSSLTISGGHITESAGGASTSTGSTSTGSTSTSTSSTSTGSSATGKTFTSNDSGDHWTGTAGNDTFNVGRGGDVLTGNGGADTFKFAQLPWAHAEVTDFSAQDSLDLSGMLASLGYSGSNPLADGHMQLVSDGSGDTQVWLNTSGMAHGPGGSWEVAQLDHVNASSLSIANGVITESGSGSTGSTSTTSTTSTSTSASSGTAGQTFTSNDSGDHWTGTAGNDTFDVGRGGDVLTGNGGSDTFVFNQLPWAHAEITDFSNMDTIDLSHMFTSLGYTTTNPVADGHMSLIDDGQGDAQVWLNTNGMTHGPGGSWEVAQLDHVSASSLHVNGAFITG